MPELQHKQCTPSFLRKSRENKRKRHKNENRKPTKWTGKTWREKIRVPAHLGKKLKKCHNFFKFQFKIALNGYLDKFPTLISLHLPQEALNTLFKIQFTIGTNF